MCSACAVIFKRQCHKNKKNWNWDLQNLFSSLGLWPGQRCRSVSRLGGRWEHFPRTAVPSAQSEQRRRQRGESSGAGDTQHPHFQAEIPGQNALNLRIYLFQKPNKCICKYCIKSIWEKIYFSSFFVLGVLQRVSPNYFRKTIFYKSWHVLNSFF